jgi:hypothetical protein
LVYLLPSGRSLETWSLFGDAARKSQVFEHNLFDTLLPSLAEFDWITEVFLQSFLKVLMNCGDHF